VRVTRWPLHPRPIAGEVLSSWLTRIAAAYELPLEDLLVHDLGHPALTGAELDVAPPETLLTMLCERTGVSIPRIRSMTVKGWSHALIGRGKPGATFFSRYVKRYSILLSPDRREGRTLDGWRPWVMMRRLATTIGCPGCLSTDEIPYRRLHWCLALTASCPTHGIYLEPVLPPPAWRIPQVLWMRETVPERLRALDKITLQALACGHATLPHTSIPTGLWLRLLRTILDELNTTAATAGAEHRVLKAVWRAVDLPTRVTARVEQPFEDMDLTRQAQFLHAAAEAIALVRTHKLETKGRDVSLLGEPPPRRGRPTKRSQSAASSTASPPAQPTDRWREALETAEALLKSAHETPGGARDLRALLLFGSSNPKSIARVDRCLAAEGIAIPQ